MKNILLPLLLLIIGAAKLAGQCYPVFSPMLKQPPKASYNINSAYHFPYEHFYTTYSGVYDPAGTMEGFTVLDDTGWYDIPATLMSNGGMRLSFWGNRIIGNGFIRWIGNTKAPTGKYYLFWEYKNGSWDTLPGSPLLDSLDYVYTVMATKTGLYYCHRDQNGKAKTGQIYFYDNSLKEFRKIIDYERDVYDVQLQGGSYRTVLSQVIKINGTAAKGFCYISGDTVTINTNSEFTPYMLYGIDGANDRIYAIDYASNPSVRVFKNSLISKFSTKVNIYSGAPNISVLNGKIIWNTADIPGYWYSNVLCPGETKWKTIGQKQLYNANRTKQGFFWINSYTKQILELADGAEIQGTAYMDMDSSCSWDTAKEQPIRNNIVEANGDNYSVMTKTDDDGAFSLFVIPDNYIVKGPGKNNSPCGNAARVPKNDTVVAHNIATLRPGFYDLKLDFLSFRTVRWNSSVSYRAHIQNIGEAYNSGHFEFKADPKIKLLNGSGYTVSGSVASGKLYDFEYYDERLVSVYAWIDTVTTKPDSFVCVEFAAFLDTAEIDSSNNVKGICQKVVYSFDPNHKECDKEQIMPKKVTNLQYMIGFQNEGTDIAEDIVIKDTLSSKLDMESFKIIGSSHAFSSELNGNVLTITFAKINLKTKKESDLLSQGYFAYTVNCKSDLEEGDSITNTASIYFDLNAPIMTNAAVTKITTKASVRPVPRPKSGVLVAYPNPSNSTLYIYTGNPKNNQTVTVYSVTGEIVAIAFVIDGKAEFHVDQWAAGFYVARTDDASVEIVVTK